MREPSEGLAQSEPRGQPVRLGSTAQQPGTQPLGTQRPGTQRPPPKRRGELRAHALLARPASPRAEPAREPDVEWRERAPERNAPRPAWQVRQPVEQAAHAPPDAAESGSRAPRSRIGGSRRVRRVEAGSAVAGAREVEGALRQADGPPLHAQEPLPGTWPKPVRRGWRLSPLVRLRGFLQPLQKCDLRTLPRHEGDGRSARRPSRRGASATTPRHLRRLNWSEFSSRRHRVRGVDPGLLPA